MAIFLTGSTDTSAAIWPRGFFTGHSDSLNLLVRAKSEQEARGRLWQSLQLHFEFPEFRDFLAARVRIFRGDLTSERLDFRLTITSSLCTRPDSLVHCAASLNRKSEKQCLNVNLRGSLEVIQLARRIQDHHGLRRYSHVSTVAVAGTRQDEVVREDEAIDWSRSDYDPYARTKKFVNIWCINSCRTYRGPFFALRSFWATAASPRPLSLIWCKRSACSPASLFCRSVPMIALT